MEIRDNKIDSGKGFDWGKTSRDYAKYRDIYPIEFYQKIADLGLCVKGQWVLDLGTGTGVLLMNMYPYGAEFVGTDISENQIIQAKELAARRNMEITFEVASAEEVDYPENSFDVITACQCYFYFNHEAVMPKLARLLKHNGKYVILYMAWLPYEDKIAGESEKLILKYNPEWSGNGETRHPIRIPECAKDYFDVVYSEEYDLNVPFSRESWNGRMKACRGVGASLSEKNVEKWEKEHRELLYKIAPEKFNVLHYAAIALLKVRK